MSTNVKRVTRKGLLPDYYSILAIIFNIIHVFFSKTFFVLFCFPSNMAAKYAVCHSDVARKWSIQGFHQPRSQGLRGETVTKTLVKFVLSFQNFGKKIACAVRHNRIQPLLPLLQYGCVALRMRFFPQNFRTIK